MAKIYIIGSVGSGKTTLARKLSNVLNVKCYELDNVTWEYNPNGDDRRRTDKEINLIFKNIISEEDWIIENVGKNIYNQAYEEADVIIYLNLRKITLYKRVIIRWLKRKVGLYFYPLKPNIKSLMQELSWIKSEKRNNKLETLINYKYKLIILDEKTLDDFKYL